MIPHGLFVKWTALYSVAHVFLSQQAVNTKIWSRSLLDGTKTDVLHSLCPWSLITTPSVMFPNCEKNSLNFSSLVSLFSPPANIFLRFSGSSDSSAASGAGFSSTAASFSTFSSGSVTSGVSVTGVSATACNRNKTSNISSHNWGIGR